MFGLFSKEEETPFVSEINYYPQMPDPGKADFDDFDLNIEKFLMEIAFKLSKVKFIRYIINEILLISLKEKPELKFTIFIHNNKIEVTRQWKADYPSKIVFNPSIRELQEFNKSLEKGYLSEAEAHWYFHLFAKPAMEGFYCSPVVTKVKNPLILKLHRLVHLELLNPHSYLDPITGQKIITKITVINVIGQFLLFHGHHGVAPIILELTLEQALDMLRIVRYKLPNAQNKIEYLKYLERFLQIRGSSFKSNPEFYRPRDRE